MFRAILCVALVSASEAAAVRGGGFLAANSSRQLSSVSCCDSCSGRAFCSPNSGNCYDAKSKDYYSNCTLAALEETLASVSAREETSPAPQVPQCCADCVGKLSFFSPLSGNCHKAKSKDYYQACPEVRASAVKSDCKVGGNDWCAATVPNASFSLKRCLNKGMRIKALTYNLFWWNLFGLRGGNDGSAGALVKTAASYELFDIVGFQECDGPDWIMGDANMTRDEYDYVKWNSNTLAYRKSRFEKLAVGNGELVAQDYGQYTYRRGVHWMRLKEIATGNTLFVMNHHGPLPINTGGVCGGEATAYNIINAIAAHSHEGDAVLVMGDFNADGRSRTVQTLKEFMHHLVDDWVDNFFGNCGGESVKEIKNLGKGGSDHNAIMTIVEF